MGAEKIPKTMADLDSYEAMRVEGNKQLMAGQFKEALGSYYTVLGQVRGIGGAVDAKMFNEKRKQIECNTYTNMAVCHIKQHNWKRALECAEEALKVDEFNAKAKFRKFQAMAGKGQVNDAIKGLRELHKVTADDAIVKLVNELEAKQNEIKNAKSTIKAVFPGADKPSTKEDANKIADGDEEEVPSDAEMEEKTASAADMGALSHGEEAKADEGSESEKA